MLRYNLRSLFLVIIASTFSTIGFSQIKDTPRTDTTTLEEVKEAVQDNIPIVSLEESDDEGGAQNITGQANTFRDPFYSAALFHFSVVRFRMRGYDQDRFGTYMNGVPMENLDHGNTPYGLWGGLNDVMRRRESSWGLAPSKYGFGDYGGITSIDTRASHQRKQTSISYDISDRTYTHFLNLTHSTGLNKQGWAFSLSASRRVSDEGYVDGTYYNGWSGFLGIDKKFNDRHLLSFVALYAPTETGRQGASTQEMYDIAGSHYYNPNWGYQNGVKRNATVSKTNQPVFIMTHEWQIAKKTNLVTAGSFLFGKNGSTGLDWFNAPDPRPDYYKYLPSYQEDPLRYNQVLDALKGDVNLRQINWDKMYNANYSNYDSVVNAYGIRGDVVKGKLARYLVNNHVTSTNKFNFNTTLNAAISPKIDFTAGATYEYQKNNYYDEINDLLGADFFVNLNQYAERDNPSNPDAAQNDLNHPNKILQVGDRYGYDYVMNVQKATAWAQSVFKIKHFNFVAAVEHSFTSFYRLGNFRNGLFADDSYGQSATYNFYNYAVKGGVYYKMNNRNSFFVNASYLTKAPYFGYAYLSPRTRDFVQDNLQSESDQSFEGGYSYNSPVIKFRVNAYYTQFKNQMKVVSFYDDNYRNFVNDAFSGIGQIHEGFETGAEVKIYKGLSATAAASVGRYTYTRMLATVTVDNSNTVLARNVPIYTNNYRVPQAQEAYSVGLSYRSPQYWFVNVNLSYFDQMFSSINEIRRTYAAVEGVPYDSKEWHDIIDQEQLKYQYSLDGLAGYSWLMNKRFKSLKKSTFLVFSLSVNNILNNQDIVNNQYEQLRFDFTNNDPNKFAPKKTYSYGTNFSAKITYRF